MGYLDGDTVTVDAILTKSGRRRLSEGTFNISHFALSDDFIDYSLWNINHPSGSDSYDDSITSLPLGGGGEYGGTKNLQRASNIVTGMGENAILGLPVPALGRMMRLLDQYKQGDGFIGQQW